MNWDISGPPEHCPARLAAYSRFVHPNSAASAAECIVDPVAAHSAASRPLNLSELEALLSVAEPVVPEAAVAAAVSLEFAASEVVFLAVAAVVVRVALAAAAAPDAAVVVQDAPAVAVSPADAVAAAVAYPFAPEASPRTPPASSIPPESFRRIGVAVSSLYICWLLLVSSGCTGCGSSVNGSKFEITS